jgi:hypothetical protein
MSYLKYHGKNVSLENLDFAKRYKVFCEDEVQARYILSLSLMERINKLDEIYKSKNTLFLKKEEEFLFA